MSHSQLTPSKYTLCSSENTAAGLTLSGGMMWNKKLKIFEKKVWNIEKGRMVSDSS